MSDAEPVVPELRSIGGWDIADLAQWTPPDPSCVALEATLHIGARGGDGADTFFARIATPDGLKTLNAKDGLLSTGRLLVFDRYDFEVVETALTEFVAGCGAASWTECVQLLQRRLVWECEGMTTVP